MGLAVAALLTRHPVYLAALPWGPGWCSTALAAARPRAAPGTACSRWGVFVWALTIPFNALMIHAGDYVLFRLPEGWPLVGGAITLEAVLYGAASGWPSGRCC